MRFDLRLLPAFVAVAEEQHFGRAAERLHLAQPALSQQVRRLEAQLGVRLLDRGTRRATLTAAGAALLPEARAALQAAERGAVAARAAGRGERTHLRVGIDIDVPDRLIEPVRSFAGKRPDVRLQILRQHQGYALAALHDAQLDVVLGWDRMPYGKPVHTAAVGAVEIMTMIPAEHPEGTRTQMPREVFAQYPFVMFSRETSPDVADWLVHEVTGRQREQLTIDEVDSLDDGTSAMLRRAARCRRLTLAMRDGAAAPPEDLVAVPFAPPVQHRVLLMWPPGRESAVIRALVEHCSTPGEVPSRTTLS